MKRIYFLGIGGTAMASAAVAFKHLGYEVSGSDRGVYPPMSDFLETQGIPYHDSFEAGHIAGETDLFIIGNAMSRGNAEVEEILNRRLPFTSLAQAVSEYLIKGNVSVVVTGTHGKTTTTSLIAWLLDSARRKPGFLIGGAPLNFTQGCKPAEAGVFVTEGDEYDTAFFDKRSKFVHYRPDVAVVNNIEFDHADIFDSLEDVKKTFRQFINLVPGNGRIIANGDDPVVMELAEKAFSLVETFGLGERCEWRVTDIRTDETGSRFTVVRGGERFGAFQTALAGEYNVRNALAAIAACHAVGVSAEAMAAGLESFAGVKRRMEVIAEIGGITLIDDFAHHPTAIAETLKALRLRYPNRRLWALFEPRSNTTTRSIFQNELTEALSLADVALLGAVNRPERFSVEERLSPEDMVDELRERGIVAEHIPQPVNMSGYVMANCHPGDVIAIMSNGSFGGLHGMLIQALSTIAGE